MPKAPPTSWPPPPCPHLSVRPRGGVPQGRGLPGADWAAALHVACRVPVGLPAAAPPAAPGESILGGKASSWAGGLQPRGLATAQASEAEEIGLEGWRGAAAWGSSIWHMPFRPRDSLVTGREPSWDLGRSWSIVLSSLLWTHIAGAKLVVLGDTGRGTGCGFGASPRGPWPGPGRSALRHQALRPGAVLRAGSPHSCQVLGLFSATTGTASCLGFLGGGTGFSSLLRPSCVQSLFQTRVWEAVRGGKEPSDLSKAEAGWSSSLELAR